VGNNTNPHLGGKRLGPYRVRIRLRERKKEEYQFVLVLQTKNHYEDIKRKKVAFEKAFNVVEELLHIEIHEIANRVDNRVSP